MSLIAVTANGQKSIADTTVMQDKVKTGWNFGLLPAISWDNDLGFQYGGLINLYHYGDGARYPLYNHSIYLEVSAYTRGSGIYRMMYDSDQLIKGIGLTIDVSYLPNQAYNFYGWNGYEAAYQPEWEDDGEPAEIYRSRVFYRYDNRMFRFKTDVNGKLSGKFRWLAGLQYYHFDIATVDVDKLNKGKNDDDRLPPTSEQPGLYDKYVDWGLIPFDEATGGSLALLKGGVMYDSRDNKPNPMRGIWSEAAIEVAPKALGTISKGYAKLSITHRQYFTIIPRQLAFAARVSMQTTVAGHTPFYMQPLIITSLLRGATEEGLGGVRNLRGAPRNRVVGDGIAYGNFELRWKALRATFWNQNFYLGVNAFADAGQVIKKIDIREHVESLKFPDQDDYFDFGAEGLHVTYGLGIRIAMNQNFIVAADYGIAVDKRDGTSGFYIGLNYLF
ncbi:MAG TPA: BamA/TamA family outer membrane protein [Bacteroidales bacterium]|nr:BamA/TamA family outer membrane protein [Bacteroidales bacterium]